MPTGFSLRNDKEQKILKGIPITILPHGFVDSVSQKNTNLDQGQQTAVSKVDNATEDQDSDESTLIIVD